MNLFSFKINDDTDLFLIEPRRAEKLNALIENNKAHIKRNLKQFADGEGFALGIRFRGEIAGQIDFNYFDPINRKTEIGYWLGESFQGNGLVTKKIGF